MIMDEGKAKVLQGEDKKQQVVSLQLQNMLFFF